MKKLFFETIDSTNAYLIDHYKDLEDMTFLSTDYQYRGRGRMGRTWMSEKGKICISLRTKLFLSVQVNHM